MKKFIIRCLSMVCIAAGMLAFTGCGSTTEENVQAVDPGTQDTNATSDGGTTRDVVLSGSVQKGPMMTDSSVEIYELDDDLNQTGVSFQTKIVNDSGQYSLPVNLASGFVELFAKGYYFDEIAGTASSGWLTLTAIADVDSSTTLNINLLTTLAKSRILALIDGGLGFEAASNQAQGEVLAAFGITTEVTTAFDQMSILEDGDDNAVLLAVSAIMMRMAHLADDGDGAVSAALSEIISDINGDLQDNGQVDSVEILALFNRSVMAVDPAAVKSYLEEKFPEMIVPDFGEIIASILDLHVSQHVGQYLVTFTCTEGCDSSLVFLFMPLGQECIINIDEFGNIFGDFHDCSDSVLSISGTKYADDSFEAILFAPSSPGAAEGMRFGYVNGVISETGEMTASWDGTGGMLELSGVVGTLSGSLLDE